MQQVRKKAHACMRACTGTHAGSTRVTCHACAPWTMWPTHASSRHCHAGALLEKLCSAGGVGSRGEGQSKVHNARSARISLCFSDTLTCVVAIV